MLEKLNRYGKRWITDENVVHDSKTDFILMLLTTIRDHLKRIGSHVGLQGLDTKDEELPRFMLYWANKEGLAEHGSSVYGSWLTDKGHELLRDIETVLKEEGRIHGTSNQ